ncbi:hypothetical protein ACWXWU_07660 [Shewanella sp. A14]
MFVKTLLCRDGRDSGLRLMAIILAAFLLLTIAAIVFPASLLNLFITLMVMPIVGLSAIRRLNDANKSIVAAIACVVPVLLFGISTYFIAPLGVLAGIFLFGLACGGYFAFLPTKNSINYVQGYNGPNMVQVSHSGSVHNRQEPVIKGLVTPTYAESENEDVFIASHSVDVDKHPLHQSNKHIDQIDNTEPAASTRYQPLYVDQDALQSGSITELAKSWLNVAKLHHVKLIFLGKIIVALCVVSVVVYLIFTLINVFSSDDVEQNKPTAIVDTEQKVNVRQMVKLPDGFWLALEDNILIVRWLGDRGDAQQLWSLATAKGDKTCSNLEFNDGSRYRPIAVDLLQDGATEARFTPLDMHAIVNNVALRGSFKLCGYDFSLKGSQATLMQNPKFETILSQ